MNDHFEILTEICKKQGVACTARELRSIASLSRKLDVTSKELVSMIVLELLEDKSPPASGIPTLLSRIKKRIVRDYEKQRRSSSLAVDPSASHDESERLALKEAIESLSPIDAEIIRLALDGESVPAISIEVRKSTRTVYRRLRESVALLTATLK